jgi:hypothetical protein
LTNFGQVTGNQQKEIIKEMENQLQSDTRQHYAWASAIAIACYVAIAVAVVTFLQDFSIEIEHGYLQFGKKWIHKIPEWLLLVLDCGCWCAIFLCIGDYCKKFLNFKSSLFAVLAGLEAAIFLLNLIDEDVFSFAVIALFFIVAIAYSVIMLIVGIQMNKTAIQKQIPAALIIYSIASFVFVLLLPAIMIDAARDGSEEMPAWLTAGLLITSIIPLGLISKVFGTMSEKEDLEDIHKEIFNNK